MMEYQGYIGKVEFDDEASVFHGEVINTRDVITFQGKSVAELKKAFRESVDDYLVFCAERGEEPDKPFSGQFVTRLSQDLHRQVSLAAGLAGKSLNAWVADQLQSAVEKAASAAQRGSSRGDKTNGKSRKTSVSRRKHA
jgi:predicted HicB family RNase H-like nuclease